MKKKQLIALMMSFIMAFSTPLYTFAAEGAAEGLEVMQEGTDQAQNSEDGQDDPMEDDAVNEGTTEEQQDLSEEASEHGEGEMPGSDMDDSHEEEDPSEGASASEKQTKDAHGNDDAISPDGNGDAISTEIEADTETSTESDSGTEAGKIESDNTGSENDLKEQETTEVNSLEADEKNARSIDPERSYISDDKYVYTGKSILPEIVVYAEEDGADNDLDSDADTDADTDSDSPVLREGIDYEVFYHNLRTDAPDTTNAGEIEVTVKGIGHYTGELKGSYEIVPMDIKLLQEEGEQDKRSDEQDTNPSEQERTVETGKTEQRYNAAEDGPYLLVYFTKNGQESFVSSGNEYKRDPFIILENTEWQLSAKYYEVKKGEIVDEKDVTKKCRWKSTDVSGETLTVNSSGKMVAGKSNSESAGINVEYDTKYKNEDKTVSVQIDFLVSVPTITEDTEEACCLALNYLLSQKSSYLQSHQYVWTVEEGAYYMSKSGKPEYIQKKGEKQRATMNHFISAAAGPCTFSRYMSGNKYIHATLFTNDSKKYLVFGYKGRDERYYSDSFYSIIQEGISLYNRMIGKESDGLVVTGVGLGGVVAKYFSYTKGCRSVTFNSESALSYVSMNAFEDMCRNYDPDNLVSYVFNDKDYSSDTYRIENYYTMARVSGNNTGIGQMLSYDETRESIKINTVTSEKTRNPSQRAWERNFYLGDNRNESPGLEPSVTGNYAACVCFGGEGNDTFRYTQDRLPGAFAATSLRILNIMANMYSGTKLYGTAKLIFDEGMNIAEGEKLGKIALDGAADATDYLPGIAGQVGGAVASGLAFAQIQYDIGRLIYGGIYPDNNIFVGGEGNDTMYGSPLPEWYFYTDGDGYDTIYDGRNGVVDNVYLLGISKSRVSIAFDPEQDDMLRILIDDQPAIDFHIDNGGVAIFYESPFDNRNQTGTMYSRKDLQLFAQKINYDKVKSMHEAACPVDMLVLDADGNTVQELLDGTESFEENERGMFEVLLVDGEYVKTAVLYDGSCRVVLRGTGDGTMLYAGIGCDDEGRVTQSCSIEGIPVQEGEKFYVAEDYSQKILETEYADGTKGPDITYDTSVQLSEHEITMELGEQKRISVDFATNSAFKEYFWVVTDDTVIDIDEEGTITAVGGGEASVVAMSLDGSYTYDACKVTVTDQDLSVEDFTITGLSSSYEYTGKVLEISLDISYRGRQVIEGTDYELEFSELVEPGDCTLSISGTGRFTGTRTLSYKIDPPVEPTTVDAKVQQLLQQCRAEGVKDEWDTALWFHDWLINNANYDYTYTNYYADGVLLKKTGVCNSYSLAYQKLLDAAGITNTVVHSEEMDHAWNMVRLDGAWCHVDCTWDDPGLGGAENHQYFGMNDEMIAVSHVWPTSSYPASTAIINFYPYRKGYAVVSSQKDIYAILSNAASKQEEEVEMFYLATDPDYDFYEGIAKWYLQYDWKYGIESLDWIGYIPIRLYLTYTDPWEQPSHDLNVPCPAFTLHGPNGTYDLPDYEGNAVVLIFGPLFNTTDIMEKLHENISRLRAAGVEVIMNLNDASTPEDFANYQEVWPDFVYTYGNYNICTEMRHALGFNDGWIKPPEVFLIDQYGNIAFYSASYVEDPDEFIELAINASSGKALPETIPADPDYEGIYYVYNGDDEALAAQVRRIVERKLGQFYVKDGTWTGDGSEWSYEHIAEVMRGAAEELKVKGCDFREPEFSSDSDPYLDVSITGYGKHVAEYDYGIYATCTTTGKTVGSHCRYCGIVIEKQETVPALGHDMEFHEAVAATCESTGSIEYYSCNRCGKIFQDEEGRIPLNDEDLVTYGHDLEYHEAISATCLQDGVEAYYSCRLCGKCFRDEKALSPIERPETFEGSHDLEYHEAVPSTCTDQGTAAYYSCRVCGKYFQDINAWTPIEQPSLIPPHHHIVYHEGVEPTCEEDGQRSYYICDVCGKAFEDENGDEELTGDLTIPHGHDYSCISNEDGTHDFVCRRDESHRYTEDCSYTYTVLFEETENYLETGYYQCDKCGYGFYVYRTSWIERKNIELSEYNYVYDGNPKEPQVTVEGLVEGNDFYVTYEDNIDAGTARAVVYGMGNYTGSVEYEFRIGSACIGDQSFELSENSFIYDGKEKEPEVVCEGLTKDKDYYVIYEENVDPGTARAVVYGIGNYNECTVLDFLILPGKTTRGDMFNLANNVKVTWKEVPGAAYYKVYREGVTNPSESLDEPVIVTERLIGWDSKPGLTNGHAYRYRIVASLTGAGDSSGDSPLTYSKLMYRLKTVVIRSVKNTAPGKVTVKYDKTTSGDSYVLQYCERQDMVGAKTKVVLGAANTSYVIGGLKKGKTYYISIRVRKKVNGIDYYTTFGVAKKIKITK